MKIFMMLYVLGTQTVRSFVLKRVRFVISAVSFSVYVISVKIRAASEAVENGLD
jgi:hypothetical protein